MKKQIFAIGVVALAAEVIAQSPVDGIHQPAGMNGIKGGALLEPGIYFRDDNWFYYGTGGGLPNYKTFVYVQAPQLTWITKWKIFGASVGMDLMIPIEYRESSYGTVGTTPGGGYGLGNGGPGYGFLTGGHQFGVGDIKVEPLQLAWHWKHFDTTVAYAVWVPSGKYSPGSLVNLGDDEWTHMISLGGTWHPDDKKSWAISILHHYEINSSQVGTTVASSPIPGGGYFVPAYEKIPCSTYTLEWSVSKTILHHADVGVFGYYQKQFSDSSPDVNIYKNSEAAGIGPEISVNIPRWQMSAALRYAYEFTAYHRPQGHMVNLTVTKKF